MVLPQQHEHSPSPGAYADGPPPYSAEAELAVLGGMLIDGDAAVRAVELVDEGMFFREGNRRAFRAMRRLLERRSVIDPVTLAEELRGAGDLEAVGGLQFIASVLDAVPTAAGIDNHAQIVQEKAAERRYQLAARLSADHPRDEALLSAADQAREALRDVLGRAGRRPGLPAPLSWREVQEMPEPEHVWFADGILPASANTLFAAYPKSHKTNLLLGLSVGLALGEPALGRFNVPQRRRVGLVLMEGAAHQLRRRIARICKGHGRDPADLDGWLFIWFRPRLKFADARAMRALAHYVRESALDVIGVDCWAPVATGNSNDADDVSPQLDAFADLRSTSGNSALSVILIHHARKTQGSGGGGEGRITDLIRGSGGFGAWYDVGLALTRASEVSPRVTVRMESRDFPHLAPFAFEVLDEYAGSEAEPPSGWMRVQAFDPAEAPVPLRDTERLALERLAGLGEAAAGAWEEACLAPPALAHATFHRVRSSLAQRGFVLRDDSTRTRPLYSVSAAGARALGPETPAAVSQSHTGIIGVSDTPAGGGLTVSHTLRGVRPETDPATGALDRAAAVLSEVED